MEPRFKEVVMIVLRIQEIIRGKIILYVAVSSKIIMMAVMGAWVVPATTAPHGYQGIGAGIGGEQRKELMHAPAEKAAGHGADKQRGCKYPS